MRKVFIIITALFISNLGLAQSDTTKVEQYCEVVAQGKLFSNKVTIDVNFGEG